jgi:capsular exopolysaccharide synthesis family protein
VVREHLAIVIGCTLVALVAAGIYAEAAPKKYSAEAQMLITPIDASSSFTLGLPVLHSSADPTRDALTAASLITTPQAASAVIADLHLHDTPGALLGDVTATPIGQSSLIAVQAISTSPTQAQRIANSFVSQVIRLRTLALHQAVAAVLPGLRAQVAAETPAERGANSTLIGQLSELEQLQASPDPTITLASLAELPTAPFTPKTKLAVAAGLLGGLLIGIAAAFLFDVLDPKLRREEQIRDVLDMRVLARIPRQRARQRWRGSSAPMLPRELSFMAREGYRTLRLVLTAGTRGGSRVLLVTGSDPGEGKTTSAINLAASMAQGGKRVILIEADLRRPTIASVLGIEVARGTEHVTFGQTALADALVKTKIDQDTVNVLAVHTPRARLAEQFSYDSAQKLVADARALADYVVIDSPPIAAVVDALPLAEFVDDVLVVARLSVSRLSKLGEMRALLQDQGSRLSGVVLIGDHERRRDAGYYYSPEEVNRSRREATTGATSGTEIRRPTTRESGLPQRRPDPSDA